VSPVPGTLGGDRRNRVYGRLECRSALRSIAKGHYVRYRIFFADEATAITAGYRPCANCLPDEYRRGKGRTPRRPRKRMTAGSHNGGGRYGRSANVTG
jgi:hypothetical protein